ncbi:MAG: hypothetical protein OXF67_10465 [Cyanobacteria bacterium MAG CAR4_bin_6]|nr:hypothetical protein [Cyanobacteria bacterium MAG CAR4_bin_6]MCY4236466.1 hypothetical protein [Cyanobacteria bacterium MAG CAR2_bin_4]
MTTSPSPQAFSPVSSTYTCSGPCHLCGEITNTPPPPSSEAFSEGVGVEAMTES